MSRSFDAETLLIGVMGRPHGLQGEISLRPYGGTSDLAAIPTLLLEQNGTRKAWNLRQARRVADGWLVRLEGIESRSDAEALTNAAVWVPRRTLPPLGPGEFYVEDLVGCRVETESGAALGTVQGIFWNGAHDVITVGAEGQNAGDDGQILIPVVPDFVRLVDPAARRAVVAWEDPE
jgi:16S rRNA processing protein RimM